MYGRTQDLSIHFHSVSARAEVLVGVVCTPLLVSANSAIVLGLLLEDQANKKEASFFF